MGVFKVFHKKFFKTKTPASSVGAFVGKGKIKSVTYVEEVAAADRFELSNAEFKVPCLNHLAKRLYNCVLIAKL